MRLGVVLVGAGACGAAGAGVLQALLARQIEPCAVCGMGAGAWPAALWACGCDGMHLHAAAVQAGRMGRRMLGRAASPASLLSGRAQALYEAQGLQHLLDAQTGGRLLARCPRQAVFPLRMARTGRALLLCTCVFQPAQDVQMSMQASAGFAVRACMAAPPLLAPLTWMGAPLLPETDVAQGVRALQAMGAQRVLVAGCRPSLRCAPDALDLAALAACSGYGEAPVGAALLDIVLPDGLGALSFRAIETCAELGRKKAERELDLILSSMGMAGGRVLPFKR